MISIKINLFLLEPKKGTTVSTQMDLVYNKVKPNFKTNIIGGKCFHKKRKLKEK